MSTQHHTSTRRPSARAPGATGSRPKWGHSRAQLCWLVIGLLGLVLMAPAATAQVLPIGDEPTEESTGEPTEEPTTDPGEDPGGAGSSSRPDDLELPDFAETRTDSELGGYVVEASGSPMEVLVFEPVAPVPVDPGQPHISMETGHTNSSLSTGPVGRGLASSAWPGALLGDGFGTVAGQVTGDDAQTYPVAADARFPGTQEASAETPEGGVGLRAVANGLNIRAQSQTGEPPEGTAGAGTYESDSIATVVASDAIASTVVSVSDLALVPGVLEFGNVTTDLLAVDNPAGAQTYGQTTVSGLTIAGQGYVLDSDGLRPAGGDPVAPVPTGGDETDQLREQLGIEVSLVEQTEEITEFAASRHAGGVRVTIDTRVLRSYFEEPVLQPIITSLPPEAVELPIYPLLFLGSQIDIVIASGEVSSSAVAPFSFPDPGPPAAPPPSGSSGAGATGVSTGSGSGGSGSTGSRPASSGQAPVTAAPPGSPAAAVTTPVSAADVPGIAPTSPVVPVAPVTSTLPTPTGVGAGLVIASLLGSVAGSRGLRALTPAALGLAGGSTCDEGRPTGAPTLKAD